MRIAVPREIRADETRVALDPESCKKLIQLGIEVAVQAGAGAAAHYPDSAYESAGATMMADAASLWGNADFLLKVNAPQARPEGGHEADLLKPGAMLLASLFPTRNLEAVQRLAERNITAFSTDCIPRTTRAQAMDTLSSQANIVGYKGVLIGAMELPKYYPMFMTAAGTTLPAKVFVIGAGVAGLQAIATAKRLGASVTATDVRPEVKEQIESVGGKYVGIDLKQGASAGGGYATELSAEDKALQAKLLADHCATVDVVITTALIGGVFAPKLIDETIVRSMKPGSVIVDLGADGGGNCTLSKLGGTTDVNGVKIIAPLNLPATVATHASMLFSRNLLNFMTAFWDKEAKRFNLDWADDILKGCAVTHEGKVVHGPTLKALGQNEGGKA
ncbi:Re/Si-specific NAD(P)(+) transhydrogenase subunit alpha [Geothrix sp. PMB-07]|uniref:Re/Si-specific NAD(P)(+) transhydrogenase subunit alpha n=1 Tax=Geothrix sp. PMB-07 TaxID=3068640 RepID=UPI0027429427|nr:Re/Si-specific NAD(P)(+) transhydrogenase subunit alpha [Geothrix sp. PMB-07]WLT32691.1 Re/Si-specific NAD(P)(+) transhydrogenase subunit alpha [Geothrix sp. PMB-07]